MLLSIAGNEVEVGVYGDPDEFHEEELQQAEKNGRLFNLHGESKLVHFDGLASSGEVERYAK